MNGYSLHPKVSIISQTSGKHHFFGYHNLCPWDMSERYVLAMETDFINRPPRAEDKARICLLDMSNISAKGGSASGGKCQMLAETSAWNFQEGARAQWLPNEPEKITYNDYDPVEPLRGHGASNDNGRFVSVIFDVKNRKKERVLPFPIYAISPKGDFGLGLNFARLQKYGGYGYQCKEVRLLREVGLPDIKDDGIFRVDLKTGDTKLIIPVENEHILTHITFNPSGQRICFIDKYKLPDGGFLQRLITANPDGTNAYVLPGHVSHYDWRNDTEIFAYGKSSPKITALRGRGVFQNPILKPFLNMGRRMRGVLKQKIAGQSYMLFTDKTQNVKRIAVGCMTEDGHPQFSPDRKWVITDTYPDKNHERTLILYDWEKKKRIDVGKFKSLPEGFPEAWEVSEMRADLHPRWNRSGTEICVDSVHEGTRQMYILDVRKIVGAV